MERDLIKLTNFSVGPQGFKIHKLNVWLRYRTVEIEKCIKYDTKLHNGRKEKRGKNEISKERKEKDNEIEK
jgi:hypothetical protein